MMVADTHPLITPRIRKYLTAEGKFDDAAWRACKSIGSQPAFRPSNIGLQPEGRGAISLATTSPSLTYASRALSRSPVFKIDVPDIPTINRIMARCEQLEAFQRAEPSRQFGAPKAM